LEPGLVQEETASMDEVLADLVERQVRLMQVLED
jgi:hypothetical protein